MISTDYAMLLDACEKRGLAADKMQVLALVLRKCTAYKFRRNTSSAWQYEVVLPGYGRQLNRSKWRQITTIH